MQRGRRLCTHRNVARSDWATELGSPPRLLEVPTDPRARGLQQGAVVVGELEQLNVCDLEQAEGMSPELVARASS